MSDNENQNMAGHPPAMVYIEYILIRFKELLIKIKLLKRK